MSTPGGTDALPAYGEQVDRLIPIQQAVWKKAKASAYILIRLGDVAALTLGNRQIVGVVGLDGWESGDLVAPDLGGEDEAVGFLLAGVVAQGEMTVMDGDRRKA